MAEQTAKHCRSTRICGGCLSDHCQWSPSATHLRRCTSAVGLWTLSPQLSQASCARFRINAGSNILAREQRTSQALNRSRCQAINQIRCWWTDGSLYRPGEWSLSRLNGRMPSMLFRIHPPIWNHPKSLRRRKPSLVHWNVLCPRGWVYRRDVARCSLVIDHLVISFISSRVCLLEKSNERISMSKWIVSWTNKRPWRRDSFVIFARLIRFKNTVSLPHGMNVPRPIHIHGVVRLHRRHRRRMNIKRSMKNYKGKNDENVMTRTSSTRRRTPANAHRITIVKTVAVQAPVAKFTFDAWLSRTPMINWAIVRFWTPAFIQSVLETATKRESHCFALFRKHVNIFIIRLIKLILFLHRTRTIPHRRAAVICPSSNASVRDRCHHNGFNAISDNLICQFWASFR